MINLSRRAMLVAGTFVTWNCLATDYFLDPKFSASQRYDSNIRLLPKPEQVNFISTFSPGFDAGYRRENSELKTNFTWNQLLYDNQTSLNIDEQLSGLNYQHTLNRFKFDFISSYNSQASLTSEPTDSGARLPQTTQIRRNTLSLSPTVSYDLDEKNNASINYLFNKTTYDKTGKGTSNNSLSDYDYQQVTGTLSHQYSERNKFTATLSSSEYKSTYLQQNSQTQSAQLGWQHVFSEQLIASIAGGGRYTQTDSTLSVTPRESCIPLNSQQQPCEVIFTYVDPITGQIKYSPTNTTKTFNTQNAGFGQTFNASLQKSFERGSFSLGVSRQLSPTAQGQQQQSQLIANSSYSLSERWSTGLIGNYSIYDVPNQQNPNGQSNSLSRTYYSIGPSVNWKWTQEMNLGLSYTYRQQKYDNDSQIREGDIIQLQFNYQPQINRQVK